jgi:hypothetical protein
MQITLYSVFGEKKDRYHPVLIGCKKNAPNINKCGSVKFQREACLRSRGRVLCTRVIIYTQLQGQLHFIQVKVQKCV